jgi:hypothetical protein
VRGEEYSTDQELVRSFLRLGLSDIVRRGLGRARYKSWCREACGSKIKWLLLSFSSFMRRFVQGLVAGLVTGLLVGIPFGATLGVLNICNAPLATRARSLWDSHVVVSTPPEDSGPSRSVCRRQLLTPKQCGWPGINAELCRGRGCCWSGSDGSTGPACFASNSPTSLRVSTKAQRPALWWECGFFPGMVNFVLGTWQVCCFVALLTVYGTVSLANVILSMVRYRHLPMYST